MKKLSVMILAAMAMISCGNTYKAQLATLETMNDSMNYALGLVNGAQIKMMYLAQDSDKATVAEFMDAMQRGYDGKCEQLSEAVTIGKNIGHAIKMSEKTGLADNINWQLNEKLFFQGLVNGIFMDTVVWDANDARGYFQNAYQASQSAEQDSVAKKVIKGSCPAKAKVITLKSEIDSLNYAFGLLNGSEIRAYVLLSDSTGEDTKAFIKAVNAALKERVRNPQLVGMGEQIGKSIKEQEPQGLIGEASLSTDFELIKQGFVNGLMNFTEQMDGEAAGMYIQNTMNTIKFGDKKAEGEKFLAENALKDGIIVTESGLQYEVIKMGKGRKPSAEDRVKVHYHGTLTDGTVFDSSVDRGEPITFALNQVIKGWTEGVQLMPVGSKFRFYIPQELGYGAQAAGSIPPYSVLIFDVELLDIEK